MLLRFQQRLKEAHRPRKIRQHKCNQKTEIEMLYLGHCVNICTGINKRYYSADELSALHMIKSCMLCENEYLTLQQYGVELTM